MFLMFLLQNAEFNTFLAVWVMNKKDLMIREFLVKVVFIPQYLTRNDKITLPKMYYTQFQIEIRFVKGPDLGLKSVSCF